MPNLLAPAPEAAARFTPPYYASEMRRLREQLEHAEFDVVRRASTGRSGRMREFTHENVGFELTWVEHGSVEFRMAGTTFHATTGACVLLPPSIEHAATGWSGIGHQLTLAPTLLERAADAMGVDGRIPHLGSLVGADQRVAKLAALVIEELEDGAERDDPGVRALVDALALNVVRAGPFRARSRQPDRRIRRALERIASDFAASLSIEALAADAGMSRFAFLRTFRAQTGESPYQHLQSVRLDKAAKLLKGSSRPVLDVALACGFGDAGRFARKFRARFGCRPSEYRARVRR